MKKNISRIAALLAAAALVFGAAGCSSDDGDNNPPNSTTPVTVTGVSVDPPTVSLEAGKTATVTATVTPSNADNKEVAWSTSDDKVATVTQEGVITGVAAGSATVTVTTKDGSKKAAVTVTVTAASAGEDTPSTSVTGKATYLNLTITQNSSSEPSYAATYDGDTLGAKVSDIVTYLTNGTGFETSAAAMSQKVAGDLPVPYAVTGKNTANNSMAIDEKTTFHYYGKTVLTVTASADKAATVTGISGYFGSGKSVLQVYYTTDGGKTFKGLANDSSVTASKGVYVKDSTLNIAVAAGGQQTIELYVGKIAENAPSAGGTVELSQIELTIKE